MQIDTEAEPCVYVITSVVCSLSALTFQIPKFVTDKVLPLTSQQKEALPNFGISQLTCGETSYQVRVRGYICYYVHIAICRSHVVYFIGYSLMFQLVANG